MCRPTVSGKTKPPLPAMLFDTEDKKDKTDEESNGNSNGDDDVNGQNDEIGGDTDVLENTDQEVTAVNLSIKSAKVVLLPYSGKKGTGQNQLRLSNIGVLKELGAKVSLAKSLNFDTMCEAVAVKLVNTGHVKVEGKVYLSNLKRSDIVCKKK